MREKPHAAGMNPGECLCHPAQLFVRGKATAGSCHGITELLWRKCASLSQRSRKIGSHHLIRLPLELGGLGSLLDKYK